MSKRFTFNTIALFTRANKQIVDFYTKVFGFTTDWEVGAKPVLQPTTEPWGQRTCYIADPDGNLIEISSFNP